MYKWQSKYLKFSINFFLKRNLINFNFHINFSDIFIVNFLYLENFFNTAIKGKEFSNYPDTKNHLLCIIQCFCIHNKRRATGLICVEKAAPPALPTCASRSFAVVLCCSACCSWCCCFALSTWCCSSAELVTFSFSLKKNADRQLTLKGRTLSYKHLVLLQISQLSSLNRKLNYNFKSNISLLTEF